MIGQQVGDYKITAQLGEGGMGMVFKGQHATLGQIVAVKSLHSTLMNNQAAKDRFIREAQALARLNHPNIIGLKNFLNDAAGCFIIMEFAEGEDLEEKLQRMGLIPPQQCIPWFIDACRGLEFAHKQNIIHRDIKPSNIMVHTSGVAKLLDFGTAKLVDAQRLTQQGMTLGTVIYMSKEQLLGKPLDARSDVYSLGVTLYECVTGQLPFYDEEERKLVVKIAKEQPIPPSQHYPGISPQLEQVILKAMAKDPGQRFQSATEMEQALSGLVATGSGGVPAPSPTQSGGTPAPTPTPVSTQPVPSPGSGGGGGGGLLTSPLFLVGVVLLILGIAGGTPILALSDGRTGMLVGGLITLLLGTLIGAFLIILGLMRAKSGGGSAAPASSGAAPAAAADSGKPSCPSCGRALLAGMNECPFCNPQTVSTQPGTPPAAAPAPAPVPFNPGGTLNVNSQNAAQQFSAPPAAAAAPVSANPTLQVIDGNDKGKQYPLQPGSIFRIGRAPTCGATLNDPGVSGEHAAINWSNGRPYVEDTGSRNGVFVNNQKVQKQALNSGDLIVIGSTRMLVSI